MVNSTSNAERHHLPRHDTEKGQLVASREHITQTQMEGASKRTRLYPTLQSATVTDKERLRTYHRLEDTEEP